MGVTELVFELLLLKAEIALRGSSTRFTITIVTSYITKMTITCSPLTGHLFDTITVASTD